VYARIIKNPTTTVSAKITAYALKGIGIESKTESNPI
jgi:hypothetical protein